MLGLCPLFMARLAQVNLCIQLLTIDFHRFLMCYLVYTNYQRQGAVANMTIRELECAEEL